MLGEPVGYQVLAPTGAAATNVDGKTIHNFLKIPITKFKRLDGDALRNFQLSLEHIKFLIFDEYSMIGARLMQKN